MQTRRTVFAVGIGLAFVLILPAGRVVTGALANVLDRVGVAGVAIAILYGIALVVAVALLGAFVNTVTHGALRSIVHASRPFDLSKKRTWNWDLIHAVRSRRKART